MGSALRKTLTNNKYDHTGIYELTCADSHKSYIGQTRRSLIIRYKDHGRSIKKNREGSGSLRIF